jgi:hypothetical protein
MNQIPRLLAAAVAALPVACTHDPVTPNINSVAGDYHLQALTVTDIGSTRDWVALGATMTITLAPNGTTTGRLFMPGADAGGSDLDVSLEGNWTLSGKSVEFIQLYYSFVQDVTFFAADNRLEGNHAFGLTGVSTRIVLSK